MKLFTSLFIALFFILAIVKSSQSQAFTVSGKVRYADNNELVTSGSVKIYSLTGELRGSAPIGQQGDYILGVVQASSHELIGTPNTDPEMDFLPTGFPNKIIPSEFSHINVNGNLTGIDIYVQRRAAPRPNALLSSVSGRVLNGTLPVTEAIVYAKSGEEYLGFGVTNSKGEFTVNNLPVGNYTLVAHKIGSQSDSKEIIINEKGLNDVAFNVTPSSGILANTNPLTFALSQNYPNPFNPGTVISYVVAKEGFVSLKVYNITGEQVQELVSFNQAAGAYNIEFNAQDLSSGVYYYRLESQGFVDTKKMILVK